jgi:hypothetical protein
VSDSTSATDLYGDGELPGDADLNAPEASTETDADTGSESSPDSNADTNTEGNVDIDLDDNDPNLDILPDGPGSDGGSAPAGSPVP